MQNQLVVFDFDWSLADQDTDRYVLEVLAPDLRRSIKDAKSAKVPGFQWTDAMTEALRQLHARGITREQIENTLQEMPFHPAMARGVRALKASSNPSTDFLILSNANSVYISTILQHQGLTKVFEGVITNPARWEPNGLLDVRRRVDPSGPQHSCQVGCSPNMCKGEELDAYLQKSPVKYDRIIYVGDGSNDFCPILRLSERDLVFVRRFRGLEGRIREEGQTQGLKVVIRWWAGAWELEEHFKKLVEEATSTS